MPVLVGLTGGIASGKSSVSERLKQLGSEKAKDGGNMVKIIDADLIAREVMEPGTPALEKAVEAFGEDILNSNGTLDRKALGNIIFGDDIKRKVLNDLVQPEIIQSMLKKTVTAYVMGYRMIILDAPLLFEAQLHKITTLNVVVYCNDENQLERLVKRDKISEKDAKQRIKAQMDLKEKCKLAQYVIDNDGTKEDLQKNIDEFFKQFYPSFWKAHYEKLLIVGIFLFLMGIMIGYFVWG